MIEADLQRYYQVPLTGVWTGQLSLRRLRVLLEQLPPDSNTAYAVSGADAGPLRYWSIGDALLGRIADELAQYRWQWEIAHQTKGTKRRAPESVLPMPVAASNNSNIPLVSPHALGAFINEEV